MRIIIFDNPSSILLILCRPLLRALTCLTFFPRVYTRGFMLPPATRANTIFPSLPRVYTVALCHRPHTRATDARFVGLCP